MEIFMAFVALILGICIWVLIGRMFAQAAIDKGYDAEKEHIYVKTILLGIPAWLYVCALPDLKTQKYLKMISNSQMIQELKEFDENDSDDELPEI